MIEKADYVLGAGAVSSPFWLQLLEDYVAGYVILAGGVIVTIRLAIAIRDWRRGRQKGIQ